MNDAKIGSAMTQRNAERGAFEFLKWSLSQLAAKPAMATKRSVPNNTTSGKISSCERPTCLTIANVEKRGGA